MQLPIIMTRSLKFFITKGLSVPHHIYPQRGRWKRAVAANYFLGTVLFALFFLSGVEILLGQFHDVILECGAIVYFIFAFCLNRHGKYFTAVNMGLIGADLTLLFFDSYLGPAAGINFYFYPLILSITFIIGLENKKLVATHTIFTLTTWALVELTSHSLLLAHHLSLAQLKIIYLSNMLMTLLSAGIYLYYIFINVEEDTFDKARKKLKAVVDSNRQLIMLIDENWKVELYNERFARHIYDLYQTEIKTNTPFLQYFGPQNREMLSEYLKRAFNGEYIVEDRHIRILDKMHWYNFSFAPIFDEQSHIKSVVFGALDISMAKETEKKLEDKNMALEKLNSQLDQFIYRATHDLRAPLSSITGLINLSEGEANPETQAKYLSLIRKSIDRLNHSITTIIDYSKNNKQQLNIESIDFEIFVNELLDSVKYSETAKQVDFKINIYQNNEFQNDRERLNAIMGNLISNAIRYQNPYAHVQPFVAVEIMVFEERAIILVKDNGIGIHREHADKIFEMFYRASDKSGSGLGLYIVKEVVNVIGGNITFETEPGKGTTFRVDIPNLNVKVEKKKLMIEI